MCPQLSPHHGRARGRPASCPTNQLPSLFPVLPARFWSAKVVQKIEFELLPRRERKMTRAAGSPPSILPSLWSRLGSGCSKGTACLTLDTQPPQHPHSPHKRCNSTRRKSRRRRSRAECQSRREREREKTFVFISVLRFRKCMCGRGRQVLCARDCLTNHKTFLLQPL